jgi:hypothetical protein
MWRLVWVDITFRIGGGEPAIRLHNDIHNDIHNDTRNVICYVIHHENHHENQYEILRPLHHPAQWQR